MSFDSRATKVENEIRLFKNFLKNLIFTKNLSSQKIDK